MAAKFKLLIVLLGMALLFGGMFATYNYMLGTNDTPETEPITPPIEEAPKKVKKVQDEIKGSHVLKLGKYNRQIIIKAVEERTGEYHFTYSIPALGRKHSNKKGYINTALKSIKFNSIGEGNYTDTDNVFVFTAVNNNWNFKI